MEAHLEALVGSYLAHDGSVFICPQFHISWDKEANAGGTLPDFVALDFSRREYLVVEVTTAWGLKGLFTKIKNRDQHWFPPIKKRLDSLGAIGPDWKPRFLGLVRNDRLTTAKSEFAGQADVTFHPLEKALLGYAYAEERAKGLPR